MSRLTQLIEDTRQGRPPRPSLPQHRPSFFVPGLTDRPWHDPGQFPWVERLEAAAPAIREEVLSLRNSGGRFRPYVEPSPPNETEREWGAQYLHDKGDWDVFYFSVLGREFEANQSRCPVAANALREIPRITTMSFHSALGPHSHIPPHTGPTNAFLRVHLGLVIPDNCAMRVGEETRTWQEGKCFIFDDSFEHEVWNRSDETRLVMIFYILHPDFSDAEVTQFEQVRRIAAPQESAWLGLVDQIMSEQLPSTIRPSPYLGGERDV